MIPFRTPFFLPYVYPSLLWRGAPGNKTIYLTFDDGPIDGPTLFVADLLKEQNVKATFFCIGDNVRKHPAILQRVINDGHAVGNHTFNHFNGWKTPLTEYVDNVKRCSDMLSPFVGAGRQLFRPPYGRITFQQIRALSDYRIVMWDVLTKDYDQTRHADYLLSRAIAATRDGSIVVFHDSLKAFRNLEYMLPRFLNHFREAGYNFRPLL